MQVMGQPATRGRERDSVREREREYAQLVREKIYNLRFLPKKNAIKISKAFKILTLWDLLAVNDLNQFTEFSSKPYNCSLWQSM